MKLLGLLFVVLILWELSIIHSRVNQLHGKFNDLMYKACEVE